MDPDLDLRETEDDAARERIGEALEAAEDGDALSVVADRNVDLDLLGLQVERGLALERDYEETGPERWALTLAIDGPLADDELPSFDARQLPPQQRHEVLTGTFDELAPDEGFVLVNDHDPKPLYHELRSIHGDVVEWSYRSEGGGEWAVEVVRTGDSEADAGDVVTRFDVREIPKAERHPTIHHRYGMIPEGSTMELIAPHEPRPLQREFRARYGDAFDWRVVESEPGRARVRITKERAADDVAGTEGAATQSDVDGHHCGAHDHATDEDHAADDGNATDDAHAHDDSPADAAADGDADGPDLEVVEEFDVRDRPPAERHEAIFGAYDDLDVGEAFVFVNDHDPKPLYHQFDAEAGPEFRWAYLDRAPGEFRVLIGKAEVEDAAEAAGEGTEAPF